MIDKHWYSVGTEGNILIQTQLVPPNITPFTNYNYIYDIVYIKFIEGRILVIFIVVVNSLMIFHGKKHVQ